MEFECFPTVVMLFLISVPTNGMIVEIWLKKKKGQRNFHLFVCPKLIFLSLCLVLKQLTLCPNGLNWQLSSSWNCSVFLWTNAPYFSPSWKSTFPGKGYLTQPLLWVGKGGFLAWLPGMRETTSASSRLLLTVPWPEKSGLLSDFYHPKWEKEYDFELEESFTDWVIQVYSLIFLRRI